MYTNLHRPKFARNVQYLGVVKFHAVLHKILTTDFTKWNMNRYALSGGWEIIKAVEVVEVVDL